VVGSLRRQIISLSNPSSLLFKLQAFSFLYFSDSLPLLVIGNLLDMPMVSSCLTYQWYVLRPLQGPSCIELAGDFMSFQNLGRVLVIFGSTGTMKHFFGKVRRGRPMILFSQSNLANILLVAYRLEVEAQPSFLYLRMDIVNHSFATCPYRPYSGGRSHEYQMHFCQESMVSRNLCMAWHVPSLHSTILQI